MNERNGALGWLVGAGVLATVPLSVVLVVLSSGGFSRADFDDGGSPYLAFMEAGPFAYVVLGVSLFASLAAMVFVGLSGTRPALQPLAIGTFVPTLVLALTGLKLGQAEAEAAIEGAAPADRLTILAGSAGESLNLGLIAFIVCGVGLGLVGLASLVTAVREPRVPRLFTAVAAGTLALASFAFAFHVSAVIGTFRAVAHASPADRGMILGASFMESEPRRAFATALVGLAVLITLAGGAVVLRSSKAAAATLLSSALLLAGSLWSFEHGALSLFSSKTALAPADQGELYELMGPPSSGGTIGSIDEGTPEDLDDAVKRSAHSYRNEEAHRVSLYAHQRVTPASLHRALVATLKEGASLELVGRGKAEPVATPEWSRRFVEALAERDAVVHVLPRSEEACDACVGRGKLVGDTLVVGADPWSVDAHFDFRDADETPKVVDLEWDGSLATLIKASNIAATHGAVLSVAVK